MGRLWAVSTILRAPAGLHRKKGRALHLKRVEVGSMNRLSAEDKLRERESVESE
jgi:hypothetical protein